MAAKIADFMGFGVGFCLSIAFWNWAWPGLVSDVGATHPLTLVGVAASFFAVGARVDRTCSDVRPGCFRVVGIWSGSEMLAYVSE